MAAPVFTTKEIKSGEVTQLSGITIQGTEELTRTLATLGEHALHGAKVALKEAAEEIMTEAKKRTPVLTGALRASGHVLAPEVAGDKIGITLGFGGPAGSGNQGETNDEHVGYAVYVHFDLTKSHKVGRTLYLESAMLDAAPNLEAKLAESLRAELRRVGR